MDIDLLKTFMEVRRLRSFRRAADNLHVTQAAVSQRIKQLESKLNAPLFNREKNNIYLTSAGEQLVPYAESIMSAWQQAKQEISLHPAADVSLCIAARASIWDLYASRYLHLLSSNFPDLVLRTDLLNDDVLVKRLLNQSLDVAFLYHLPSLQELEGECLTSFELVLQSHGEKTLEQALGEHYIYVDWGRDLESLHIGELGFKAKPLMYTNQHIIAQRYVEKNNGAAFLPLLDGPLYPSLSIVADSPRLPRNLYAVWNKSNANIDIINAIVTSLSDKA